MVTVQQSRFALLNIDDDNDSDSNQKKDKQGSGKGSKPQSANKKKNKKKKQGAQQKEQEELRNLAFARGGKGHSPGVGSGAKDKQVTNDQPPTDKQWKEWQEADKDFVSESYEKDLQQALLLSKLEAEEQKKVQTAAAEDETGNARQKAKKKKDKPVTMSLEEFQQDGVKKELETNSDSRKSPDVHEDDPTFFKKVEEETHKIIRKEQIQEQYRKQYIVENARTQQYEETIRKKDEQIEQLQKENKKLKAELMEVKERNQQFCMILAQGEMKGKTTVIMELNQLKQVRDELTQEVANLTSELEKERSKVHALKASLDKSKMGKKK